MQQLLGLGADFLPVVLQRLELGEGLDWQVRLGRQLGEQVQEHVDRGQEARVITQLAGDLVPYPAAEMDVGNRENKQ
ncbi:hypothetical protein D3C84_1129030 [compost metagenome]